MVSYSSVLLYLLNVCGPNVQPRPTICGKFISCFKNSFTGIYEHSFIFIVQQCVFMKLEGNSIFLDPVLSKE